MPSSATAGSADLPKKSFRMSIAIGGDAIAAVAILWQLFPFLMVPLCA